MILNRMSPPIAALFMMAGCNAGGPSVSGSADESASSQSGSSSLWERVRGLVVEETKTIDMPALGLIADAFLQDASARGVIPVRIGHAAMFEIDGKVPRLDEFIAYEQGSPFKAMINSPEMQKLTPLDPDHLNYAMPVLIALAPRGGWEVQALDDRKVDPAFDTPFFNRHRPPPRYDPVMHQRYMEMLSIASIYTNDVFALIGKSLGGARLADPDEAGKRVLAAYQAVSPATLKTLLANAAKKVAEGRFNTDLTGSNNIHFMHSVTGDFVGDARGVTWTRAGGTWFGDGRLNGQLVSFKLASTSSLSQRQAQSGTSSTQSDARVGGTANVGPAR